MKNQQFAYAKTKTQIRFNHAFVFVTWIVQFIYFLNQICQFSCHLLCSFCKPHCWFSYDAAHSRDLLNVITESNTNIVESVDRDSFSPDCQQRWLSTQGTSLQLSGSIMYTQGLGKRLTCFIAPYSQNTGYIGKNIFELKSTASLLNVDT